MADAYNAAQVAALAHIGGFTSKDEIITATAVGLAESGGRMVKSSKPNKNGTNDWGIWQINDVHKPSDAVKTNAIENAKEAYRIYVAAGHSFKPWATYNSGVYKAEMLDAETAYWEIHDHPEIEQELKKGGGAKETNFGSIAPGSPADATGNAITGLSGSITNGFNAFTKSLFGITLNVGVLIVALVFLTLGVIVLLRSPIASTVNRATPVGRVARVARKVGG